MITEHLSYITKSNDIEDIWSKHCDKMNEYGFDRIIYGLTRFGPQTHLGDLRDNLILSNHDEAYLKGFLDDKLYMNAPMTRWAFKNFGTCSWNIIQERIDNGDMTPEEVNVVEFNRSMGVVAGYSISFHTHSPRMRSGMALTAKPDMRQNQVDQLWDVYGKEIELICQVTHMKLSTQPYAGQNRALTRRQREVLNWVGDGKTTQDIATIMNISVGAVEKHLRNARDVLQVETTAQALLKASFQNQIYNVD